MGQLFSKNKGKGEITHNKERNTLKGAAAAPTATAVETVTTSSDAQATADVAAPNGHAVEAGREVTEEKMEAQVVASQATVPPATSATKEEESHSSTDKQEIQPFTTTNTDAKELEVHHSETTDISGVPKEHSEVVTSSSEPLVHPHEQEVLKEITTEVAHNATSTELGKENLLQEEVSQHTDTNNTNEHHVESDRTEEPLPAVNQPESITHHESQNTEVEVTTLDAEHQERNKDGNEQLNKDKVEEHHQTDEHQKDGVEEHHQTDEHQKDGVEEHHQTEHHTAETTVTAQHEE